MRRVSGFQDPELVSKLLSDKSNGNLFKVRDDSPQPSIFRDLFCGRIKSKNEPVLASKKINPDEMSAGDSTERTVRNIESVNHRGSINLKEGYADEIGEVVDDEQSLYLRIFSTRDAQTGENVPIKSFMIHPHSKMMAVWNILMAIFVLLCARSVVICT
jgi:hypothetical protein